MFAVVSIRRLRVLIVGYFTLFVGLTVMPSNKVVAALPYRELVRPDRGTVMSAAWRPDGKAFVVGGSKGIWVYSDTFRDIAHIQNQGNAIRALAWSPDGKTIASGTAGYAVKPRDHVGIDPVPIRDGKIQLWSVGGNPVALTLMQLLPGPVGFVYSLAFSPDGKKLASASQDTIQNTSDGMVTTSTVRIYDISTGRLLHSIEWDLDWLVQDDYRVQRANILVWSADSRRIFYNERKFIAWDVDSGQVVDTVSEWSGSGDSTSFAQSPDGLTFATTSDDTQPQGIGGSGSISLRDTGTYRGFTGHLSDRDSENYGYNVHRTVVAWHPKNVKLLAGARAVGTTFGVEIWDAEAQKRIAYLGGHKGRIGLLAWSHDGSKLLSVASDNAVRIWTDYLTTYFPAIPSLLTLPAENDRIIPIAFSSDGKQLAIGSTTGEIQIWDIGTERKRLTLKGNQGYINDISWSPDGEFLVSASNQEARVWSVRTGSQVASYEVQSVRGLAWNFADSLLAVGVNLGSFAPGYISLWDVKKNMNSLIDLDAPNSGVTSLAWKPGGKQLVIGETRQDYQTPEILIIDVAAGKVVNSLKVYRPLCCGQTSSVQAVNWSPNGRMIVGFSWIGDLVQVWEISRDGKTARHLFNSWDAEGVRTLQFSPDSRYLLSNTGLIWNTSTGWPVFAFEGYLLEEAAWSPDGKLIAGTDRKGKVYIWQVDELQFTH